MISLNLGLRKVIRKFPEKEKTRVCINFSKERGLKCKFDEGSGYFWISKKNDTIKEAIKYNRLLENLSKKPQNWNNFVKYNWKLGLMFGYPECCIKSYVKSWESSFKKNHDTPNHVIESFLKTQGKGEIDFLLNNLSVYRLISHFPCSYNCEESLEIARSVFENMSTKNKKKVSSALKRDILFWSEESMIGFEDKFRGNGNNYSLDGMRTLGIKLPLILALEIGNKVQYDKDSIKIFNNKRLIYTYNKLDETDGILLKFREK